MTAWKFPIALKPVTTTAHDCLVCGREGLLLQDDADPAELTFECGGCGAMFTGHRCEGEPCPVCGEPRGNGFAYVLGKRIMDTESERDADLRAADEVGDLIIEVSGGCVSDVYRLLPGGKREDVPYTLRDHDNIKEGDEDPLEGSEWGYDA